MSFQALKPLGKFERIYGKWNEGEDPEFNLEPVVAVAVIFVEQAENVDFGVHLADVGSKLTTAFASVVEMDDGRLAFVFIEEFEQPVTGNFEGFESLELPTSGCDDVRHRFVIEGNENLCHFGILGGPRKVSPSLSFRIAIGQSARHD